mmetsp:Transcript_11670/g.11589  ORF Transcript_11670/g.11589 Transcript_11670/m.11589 type:complete len:172 (+) Transcript_11670:112-627(+)
MRGDIPNNRDEHTANVYENSMIVFGGFSNGERTNEIYRYYFKENKWEYVKPLSNFHPPARAGHSAVIFHDNLVVFGGKDEDNNKLNDTWEFNLTNYQWSECKVSETPLPRSGHSACIYKDFMVVFGGIYEITKELDDMIIYDFTNTRWLQFFEEVNSPDKKKPPLSPSFLK